MEIGIWYQGKWSCKQCFRFVLSGFLAFLLSVIPTGMGWEMIQRRTSWDKVTNETVAVASRRDPWAPAGNRPGIPLLQTLSFNIHKYSKRVN
jgi:hypothetical protein